MSIWIFSSRIRTFFKYLKVLGELANSASVSGVPVKVQVLALIGELGEVSVQDWLANALVDVAVEVDETVTDES